MPTINEALLKLKESKFRAGFHFSKKERAYVADKGIEVVRTHAQDFVRTRLAPAHPPNDGKQTPMRGHPVFVAQHACAYSWNGMVSFLLQIPLSRQRQEPYIQNHFNRYRHR